MVITFSNIKGSTGGAGSGEISGITLWSNETTKAYIDNALSGVTDALSAYTKTEDFAKINGSAITSGGNIVIEGGGSDYSAGSNINIDENNVISVTGITIPTKVSELTNDKGYITTADTQNFVTSGDVQTQINDSISGKADSSAVTAQISEVKQEIEAKIPSKVSDLQNDLNFASTGDVKTQIDNAVSGKQDTLVSGENIKTINNQSLLGSGNIEIQGGGEIYSAGEGIGIDANNIISVTGNYETIVELTQAQYDALTSYGKNTTYVITDAPAVNLSAYTPTSGFSTINGNVITDGGNIVIEGGGSDYSAGSNINIDENNVISVTGITIPTKLSELANDEGFVNSGEVETQITNKDYSTKNWVQDQVNLAIASETARTESTYAKIGDIPSLDGYATTEWVESQGYLTEHQSLSAYSTTEQMNQAIGSATAATTGWVESQGYLTEHQSLSAYSTTEQVQTLINTAKQEVENEIPDVSDFVTSGEVETQITNKGYLTGYTETDPVFMASAASGISEQDITNWNNKLDSSDLEPYYTSAQTNTAISNAVSGKADSSRVDEIEEVTASALVELHNTKQDILVSGTNIKTINNQSLLGSGNIEIQGSSGSDYSAGANIDITDNVISVTGITIPTSNTAFTNDAGYVNSGEVETQITNKDYPTKNWVQDQVSGKLDSNVFTAYTANTQTELSNKQDASGMTAYATTAFTESTYLKEHQSLSAYSTTEQVQTLINTAKQEVENEIPDVSDFVTSAQVNTQIESKGYLTAYTETDPVFQASAANGITSQDITNWNGKQPSGDYALRSELPTVPTSNTAFTNDAGYVNSGEVETQIASKGYITGFTETDPVFMASAASGISEQDITNWNNKLDSSALNPYYTSAQTNTAISNAVSGKTDKVSVTASSGGYKFPKWNNQGCITGISATAYQAFHNINGSSRTVYSDSSEALPTIYAPTSEGLAGQPLLSNGSDAPVWGAYKFQFISQSQYDALAAKDNTTIYFIVNEN